MRIVTEKGVCDMLVLGRKPNEQLIIDGRIVITVVRVAGGQVRLGIEAPAEVLIRRAELADSPADGRSRPTVCSAAGR
jgi:carbon storage regulator